MVSLEKHLAFVNAQAVYHETRSTSSRTSEFARKKHAETATKLRELAADMAIVHDAVANTPVAVPPPARPKQLRLALTPTDVRDLPPELLSELSVAADLAEFTILDLIHDNGGIASLDQIIVGLYRKTREIHKRAAVTSRLYRMGQKGLIHNVPAKKGAYSLEPLTELQAAQLLGESQSPSLSGNDDLLA